jgi:hypothetical protein
MANNPQPKPPRPPKKHWRRPGIMGRQLFESDALASHKNATSTVECVPTVQTS